MEEVTKLMNGEYDFSYKGFEGMARKMSHKFPNAETMSVRIYACQKYIDVKKPNGFSYMYLRRDKSISRYEDLDFDDEDFLFDTLDDVCEHIDAYWSNYRDFQV